VEEAVQRLNKKWHGDKLAEEKPAKNQDRNSKPDLLTVLLPASVTTMEVGPEVRKEAEDRFMVSIKHITSGPLLGAAALYTDRAAASQVRSVTNSGGAGGAAADPILTPAIQSGFGWAVRSEQQ
jgi:hypothetical protein